MPPNINKPLVAPVLWAARGNYAPDLDIVAYRPVYLVAAATTRATIYKVTPAALVQENGVVVTYMGYAILHEQSFSPPAGQKKLAFSQKFAQVQHFCKKS